MYLGTMTNTYTYHSYTYILCHCVSVFCQLSVTFAGLEDNRHDGKKLCLWAKTGNGKM